MTRGDKLRRALIDHLNEALNPKLAVRGDQVERSAVMSAFFKLQILVRTCSASEDPRLGRLMIQPMGEYQDKRQYHKTGRKKPYRLALSIYNKFIKK